MLVFYRPLKAKVRAFDFAHRLAIQPEYNTFDLLALKVIPHTGKASEKAVDDHLAVRYKHVNRQIIRIALKVRAECFVCAVFQVVIASSRLNKPLVFRLVLVNLDPVWPMSCHRVRVTAGDSAFRRLFPFLGIISLV